ncbi:MAG: hypothetical protein ABSB59_32750 [Streptosporangiaceae bacterium]|jgi:hypothetical protein
MTRTQERLADALQASAARVRDDRLRPLPEPGLRPARRGRRRGGLVPAAWQGWLAPAAAAVSVALVVGLALALTSAPGRLAGRSGPASAAAAVFPRYFAQFAGTDPVGASVDIRSVATGSVVASAPSPRQAGWSVQPDAMAAAPDGRTFYVAYVAQHPGTSTPPQTWIYRFSATGSALTMIRDGVITDSASIGLRASMAVSPDGTRLALTVAGPRAGAGGGPGTTDKIVVVDLRTGARSGWAGGLDRGGRTLLIPDVSWTPDGQSVIFLALWCNPAIGLNLCENAFVPAASRLEQVRSVPAASAGGLLSGGRVLLSQADVVPVITAVAGGPRPGELTLLVLSGRKTTAGAWPVATVERVAEGTGRVLGTDYRLLTPRGGNPSPDVELGADPGGQHLLLTTGSRDGFLTGWVHGGLFRPLPIRQPYLGYPITAW